MKIRAALIILCMLVSPKYVSANSGDALGALLGAALIGGAVVGVNRTAYEAWLRRELKEWKDESTDSTISMDAHGNISMETRIIGDRKMNYIFLAVSNSRDVPVVLKPEEITIAFSEGRSRHPDFLTKPEDSVIRPGWSFFILIPLPKKWDFKDQKWMQVTMPLYDESGHKIFAELKTASNRNLNVKQPVESYVNSSVLDMGVDFGAILTAIGDIHELQGTGNLYFGFDFGFYFAPAHGIRFGFAINDTKKSFDSKASDNMGKPEQVSADEIFMTYSYKHFMSFQKIFRYDFGIVGQSHFNDKNIEDDPNHDLGSTVGFYQKLTYLHRMALISRGFWRGDYQVGLNIGHKFFPHDTVAHVPVGGNIITAGVVFVLGI
ncbi:MAG: hypothetical protein HYV97_15285 [Bdellovibrio sp.]|nr:hypothetical protein [Bdellovibrio sp.]